MRWIVAEGVAHGPGADRTSWPEDTEWTEWIEVEADDAETALGMARLADEEDGVTVALAQLAVARRRIRAAREVPYATAGDLQRAIQASSEARSRVAAIVAQAGLGPYARRAWTLDETLARRTRWYQLVRAGLAPKEIERHLGYSAAELAAAVRRHELA